MSVAGTIAREIEQRLIGRATPLVVAIDGGSGAGKSSIAAGLAEMLDVAIIPTDDFYAAHVSEAEWDARSSAQRVADGIDWRRLRAEAIEPLLAGRTATWYPFDFEAKRPDGTFPLATSVVTREPAAVILLDGAYSSRPELADVIDLSVLVDVSPPERRRRLVERDGSAYTDAWQARWNAAEEFYFSVVRPRSSFEVVVNEGP